MNKVTETVKLYLNRAQMESALIGARHERIIGARGLGKSEGIDALRLLRNVQAMPRSHGGIVTPAYTKLLENTLPAVETGLARLGYYRNIHYFYGRPPKSLNWPTPYTNPVNYKRTMYWYNGSVISFLSLERGMSANSKSLDYILIFEAKYINAEKVQNEVLPALRGKREYFANCPWHLGTVFTTDMPTLKSGNWIFKAKEENDDELNDMILQLVHEKKLLYKRFQKNELSAKYYERKLKEINADLYLFRSEATLYREYDSLENLDVLGLKYIRDRVRDMPKSQLLTSIFNVKPKKGEDGFYSALRESMHYYVSTNDAYFDEANFDFTRTRIDCGRDADIMKGKPLYVALDYNSSINNIVVAQKDGRYMRTLNGMWVKTPMKLQELVNKFCDYYEPHDRHKVIYYWNSTAVAETAATADSFSDIVIAAFEARGWEVEDKYIGDTIDHDIKHQYVHMAMSGLKYLFPLFNKLNCEDLLTAMERAETKRVGDKIKKDKGDEKKKDTDENPDQHKTHATDAWDDLFIGMNFYPVEESSVYNVTHFPKSVY